MAPISPGQQDNLITTPTALLPGDVSVVSKDLFLEIIKWIYEPTVVFKMDLVSKNVRLLNHESCLVLFRMQTLFKNIHFDPVQKYTFEHYILEVSQYEQDRNSQDTIKAFSMQFPPPTHRVPYLDKVLREGIDLIQKLERPVNKLRVFADLLPHFDSTSLKTAYFALPPDMQTKIREQIWIANNRSSHSADGMERGIGFGEHIIEHDIKGKLVKQAVRNYLAKFGISNPLPSFF